MGIFRRKPQIKDHTDERNLGRPVVNPDLNKDVPAHNFSPSADFNFTQEILKEIQQSVRNNEATSSVLFSDNKQFLDVVGESYRRPLIADLLEQFGREHWFTGYLQPEPSNSYDSNAVKVMLISKRDKTILEASHVGYLGKDQAKKISRKIADLLHEGKIIPLIGIIDGGTSGKQSLGVSARAMTRSLNF